MTATETFLVDSSGWLEYITEDPKADLFAPYIQSTRPLIVPTIVLFEVYKRLVRENGEPMGKRFLSQAYRNSIVPLDQHVAISAAELSLNFKLAMADAIIYATARACSARVVTSDQDFARLPDVILL